MDSDLAGFHRATEIGDLAVWHIGLDLTVRSPPGWVSDEDRLSLLTLLAATFPLPPAVCQ
jgi:hypothetical protein